MPGSSPVATAPTVAELRRIVDGWRRDGLKVALVPTMGALHAGHVSLARLAREHADRVVVSIFVNPTQFGPSEDFGRYPRTLQDDLEALRGVGDLAFTPAVEAMYPAGFATTISLEGPATAGLEDRFRPTHFAGVATIVAKLLIQAGPDAALFGEKDYQQLKVITRMVADLDLPVNIVPGPTLREEDGLAMSSRNRYLSADERTVAPTIYRVLSTVADHLRGGMAPADATARGRQALAAEGFDVDYLEAREAESLNPIESVSPASVRLLAAARLGRTRLIDNIAV